MARVVTWTHRQLPNDNDEEFALNITEPLTDNGIIVMEESLEVSWNTSDHTELYMSMSDDSERVSMGLNANELEQLISILQGFRSAMPQ